MIKFLEDLVLTNLDGDKEKRDIRTLLQRPNRQEGRFGENVYM